MAHDPPTHHSNKEVETKYDQYLMPIWKKLNVPISRASDCMVEDFNNNEYLDAFSGIGVTNAGHRNERIIQDTKEQLNKLIHGCTYVHPNAPAAELGEKIAEITPGNLQKSFFCNSGTEAVEGAIKLARKYTGSKEVVALEMSFHGRTLGSLALTGNKSYKNDMAPTLNDVSHAAPPYGYRCQTCSGGPCSSDCAEDVQRVIETSTSGDLAAIIVEPVMGEGGIIVPPDRWFKRVQEIANERDSLLIFDEVQSGYGRTGKMWGCDHSGVVPDILTQAKGIANGLPLGAFTAKPEIADAFEAGDHLSTFGGNPVACAAALASIAELQGGIITKVQKNGSWLADKLSELENDYPSVGEVRGIGLFHGIELVDRQESGGMDISPAPASKLADSVANHMREHGVIVGVGGFHGNVLRIQPPLTITRDQLKEVVNSIQNALDEEADA